MVGHFRFCTRCKSPVRRELEVCGHCGQRDYQRKPKPKPKREDVPLLGTELPRRPGPERAAGESRGEK